MMQKQLLKKVIFVLPLCILVIGGSVVAYLFLMSPESYMPSIPADQEGQIASTEDVAVVVNAAYGTLKEINGSFLTLEVTVNEGVSTLYFETTSETLYSTLVYANDDDLVGTQSNIDLGSLIVGDLITVYAAEEIGSVSPQKITKVIKVTQ